MNISLVDAIPLRHSVRHYIPTPLTDNQIKLLDNIIHDINTDGSLHFQLVTDEPKAFKGILAYGTFSGVNNYIVVAGRKEENLDEKAGYYGEKLVLFAQSIGLDTCWAGLSYRKILGTFTISSDEKILAYIAIGYGKTLGTGHKIKSIEQVSNYTDGMPEWFLNGVNAALLAPTAVNQQKFRFDYLGVDPTTGKGLVKASKGFSIIGYTKIDLGIVRLHFELGAGKENFNWV